jgi:hypothetical protein
MIRPGSRDRADDGHSTSNFSYLRSKVSSKASNTFLLGQTVRRPLRGPEDTSKSKQWVASLEDIVCVGVSRALSIGNTFKPVPFISVLFFALH